jgi:hypothetical protein
MSLEIKNLKDTDEITIQSNNKKFHIHWGTLKTLLLNELALPNSTSDISDLLALIQGEQGYWYVGADAGNVQIQFNIPIVIGAGLKGEILPGYVDQAAANADNALVTGTFYHVDGVVYQKIA